MFIKNALYLTKRPITGKQRQQSSKANTIFQMLSCLCCLQSLNSIGGSVFSKTRNYQKIGFLLKPDDVIMMSSNCMNGKVNQDPLFDINV